jgi:uncharacterized protein YdeI (YjbR/CyaY-like superfamily)
MLEVGERLYVSTRKEWRAWLEERWDQAEEIWLVSYRKATGKPSLPYDIAVKEALCFGWIDSTRKSLDEERYAQRFTPRRAGSGYSQTNLERLARLIEANRVADHVLAELGDVRAEDFEIPDDITAALEANPDAWANWLEFPPAYRRIRAAYVDWARDRDEEFEKRLRTLVERTAKGRQFGYGIEEFYTEI